MITLLKIGHFYNLGKKYDSSACQWYNMHHPRCIYLTVTFCQIVFQNLCTNKNAFDFFKLIAAWNSVVIEIFILDKNNNRIIELYNF